ncbi:hypothetical protein [Capillimicrobium parvum]|uniref:Uncharacterized protein n=1 Tax=Capillimicrobium parvum TaxID=2884022 RepID=A0A9E6XXT4_9ACTN|nr:hypothetical protein [Capillimicrobium parvum]UGS36083.1 hypothetical protein DSM104329_02481 [Capillimicrobium parvum]
MRHHPPLSLCASGRAGVGANVPRTKPGSANSTLADVVTFAAADELLPRQEHPERGVAPLAGWKATFTP